QNMNPSDMDRTGRTDGQRTDQAARVGGTAQPRVGPEDRRFVNEAASGGLFEVQSSRLALEKATDADTKRIAQRMIDDHTKANDELKDIATRKGIEIPTQLLPKHLALMSKLQS